MKVSIEAAVFAARFFLASKAKDFFTINVSESNFRLDDKPIIINDFDRTPLLYDFHVYNDQNELVGAVRCAADSVVGDPVVGFYNSPIKRDILEISLEKFKNAHSGASENDSWLVCYCFPKIGVIVSGTINDVRIIELYDANTAEHLTSNPDFNNPVLGEKREGFAVKSYKDSVPDAGPEEEGLYRKGYDSIKYIIETAKNSSPLFSFSNHFFMEEERSGAIPFALTATTITPEDIESASYEYVSRYFRENPPVIRSLVLPVSLFGQETRDYCAMATAQMIFSYFNIDLTQADIASLMNYQSGGSTPDDQYVGYQQIIGERMLPVYDKSPTWEEAVAALEYNIPFKSGLPAHARVCRGWKRFDYLYPKTKALLRSENYLLINDPSPVGTGQTYWEAVNIHIYQNALTFKPKPASV